MVTNNMMGQFQRIGRGTPLFGRPAGWLRVLGIVLATLSAWSCATPDPKALLRVSDVETYWILDPSRTEKRLLAPTVRFKVENISEDTLISVDATAAFRRDGSDESWGSGFFRLTEGRKRLAPGARVIVTMSSDARYSMEGDPKAAFTNPTFKPVNTKFFLRVGASSWIEFGGAPVENVIGSKDARAVLSQPPS